MVQIGIMIEGQDGLNWNRWKRILQAAEDFGFQCVFRSDHYTNADPPEKDSLELWASLIYAASHTSRIEFGPLVTPVTFRHPTMTIRSAAAVDDLSGGRLVLGMGAGWQDREHLIFGVPFYNFTTRFKMLEEALQMTKLLLTSDEPVTFNGEHFWLDDAILLPRPQRAGGPPILIGGKGPKRTLPLIAKYAKEWNGVFMDHALYKERAALLDELLEKEGRQPSDVKRSLMHRAEYGSDEADHKARVGAYPQSAEELAGHGYMVGRGQEFVDQIADWAELGVERFMLQWLDQDNIAGLEAMAKDVLPHFHK